MPWKPNKERNLIIYTFSDMQRIILVEKRGVTQVYRKHTRGPSKIKYYTQWNLKNQENWLLFIIKQA